MELPVKQPVVSAGLLVWRPSAEGPQFLLGHMGGPYWAKKDAGAWTIPKGLIDPGEDPLAAARREFQEETGLTVEGPFEALTPIIQKAGKQVRCWLVQGDPALEDFVSNTFKLEWPPRSGVRIEVPELDRVAWFSTAAAEARLVTAQAAFVREAQALLNARS
jgi:predicted NUDIX family NTP pyrophosphohydrolase